MEVGTHVQGDWSRTLADLCDGVNTAHRARHIN